MPEDAAPAGRPVPLFGERALHVPDARAVIVGDLHVGLETDLARGGVRVPSQTPRMRDRLQRLVTMTGAERLIVIGDLKHTIPTSTRQEVAELPDFFDGIDASVELVRGNHDVDIDYLPDVVMHPATGIRVGDVGLAHGHTWPDEDVMRARTIATCHNHPAVMLVDALGHRHKEPAWIRARFTDAARERYTGIPDDARLIVVPAFNELVGGIAFNAHEGQRLLGPLFSNGLVDVDRARAFTLDGVDLGSVRSLRRFAPDREPRRGRGRHRKT